MKKQDILKLNANFFPVSVGDWKKIFVDIVSGACYPIDVSYEVLDDGTVNQEKIESFQVIRTFEEWSTLPIRPYDEYIQSAKRIFRLPPIVVCAHYKDIHHKKVIFPTKSNIWKRDKFICAYTGVKLTKDQLSIDHIIPKSRGGPNTWENLITASKEVNVMKGNRTPKEAGLKLLYQPVKPKNGIVFPSLRKEWQIFLDGDSQ